MDKNQEEFNELDDLNIQVVNEEEPETVVPTRLMKGASLTKGGEGTEGTDGETVQTRGANDNPEPAPAEHDPPVPLRSTGPVSIISDKLGQDHPIHAKQLEDTKTVTLTGDITGTGHWNFAGAETMDTDISENAVTNRELAANSVVGAAGGSSGSSQKSNIVQGSIGLADINSGAIDTTVAAGSSNLVTSGAVQTAINNAVSGRGTTYGPMTVDEINALQNVNDGSTVHVSGQGTGGSWVINDGISDTGVAEPITVRDKSDLRYMNNDTKHGWYSLDAEFKLRQNEVPDPQVPTSGTTESISFIDSIRQNENGEITPSKKNVRQASTSQAGVVQLTNATDSNSETLAATAKAVKTVKDATDSLSSGKKDKQTPITGNQGSTAKTLTGIAQNADGVITPTFENIQSANATQPGLMSAADYRKLDALPTNTVLENKLAGKKDDQTPVDTDSATGTGKGGSLRTLTRLQQNANGDITATFTDIPEAVATVGETVGSKGLMSEADKTKLDAVKPGATKVEASETNGNIKIDGVETNVYTHPSSGETSHGSKGDTQNKTPGFGETFKSISATVDIDGHTTALGEHTVKIPDALATPSTGGSGGTSGLMSAADKETVNKVAAGDFENQNAYSHVKVATSSGDVTIDASSTTDTFKLAHGTNVTLAVNAENKTITIDTVSQAATATPSAVSSAASVGSSTKYAKEDHVHNIVVGTGTNQSGSVKIAGQEVVVKDWNTKADKVTMTTGHAGNFASLDENGNIQDSGHKHTDYKVVQTAVTDPTSEGVNTDNVEFISGISQNTQGVISPIKNSIRGATASQTGVVQLAGAISANVATENNKAASEKAVRDAINDLDVTAVGEEGKYIQAIGETDGKISATAVSAATDAASGSKTLITAGGVYTAISKLDVTDTAVSHEFVTAVSETDGKISVSRGQPVIDDVAGLQSALDAKQPNLAFDGEYNAETNKVATVSSVTSRIDGLDATVNSAGATGVTPNFGIQVVETDGKITAVTVTSDGTEKTVNKVSEITSTNKASTENYPSNKAIVDFVNSSVGTATANFLGTFDVESDLHLQTTASTTDIASALVTVHPWRPGSATIPVESNNDYVFVKIENSAATGADKYQRYKYNGTSWAFEYELNNSSFTQEQWNAIVSGITSTKVTNYDSHLENTNNPHSVTKAQVGLGNVDDKKITVSATDGVTNVTDGITYKYTHPTATAHAAAAVRVGNDGLGHVVLGATLTKGDVELGNVDNKSSATLKSEFTGAIADGNTGFVTGDDAYDALALKQDNLSKPGVKTGGSATQVPQITTNEYGQVTSITNVTISGVAPAAHTHGNIQDGGTLQQTDVAIANGDKLVITDYSDGNKVARASAEFDGSTTTTALTPKGTFVKFLQDSDIAGKADKSEAVTDIKVSGTKISKTVNGVDSDVAYLEGTYNASSNKIATQSTVSDAVSTAVSGLDAEITSSDGTNVQVKVTEENGKITAVNITDNTANKDHVHGDIHNNGTITASAVAIASGDAIVVTDSSASGKVVKSGITFDGTTATQALTKKGTWETINNQNVFSKVKVGSTEIVADSPTDTLELVAGSGITLTPDATNDKVTIAHTNSVTAGSMGPSADATGLVVSVPHASYDANGHITASGSHTYTIQNGTTSQKGVVQLQDTVAASESSDTTAATPKAVREAINALDVNSAGGDGKYIKSISEEDGKIVPIDETMDTTPTEGSNKAVTSGGIWSELDKKVDVDDMVSVVGRATYDATEHRLTFNDIIFDNIYPVVGKYGLAVFSETTAVQAAESSGDKEWLLDWRPYLIDMTAVQGETAKTPVAELNPGNWLRKTDGSYAPVCGITSAQSTALNGKADTLYFGNANSHSTETVADIVHATEGYENVDVYDGTTFNPANLWKYLNDVTNLASVNSESGQNYSCAIEVEVVSIEPQQQGDPITTVYKYGAYTGYHIPAPWETTETKYSVFIGRTSDVYVIDGVESGTSTDSSNNTLYMRGLAAKPVPVGVDGFDPEDYRLRRTGISPGPSTVVASKIRNFFYNYVTANSTNATVNGAQGSIGVCYNNGTYPATNGPNQNRTVEWARGCNAGGANGSAVPVAEGGYHSLNAFLCSIEAAYKTRACFGLRTAFSTGNSSNDTCNSAETFRTNGGFELDGDGDTKYYFKFNANMKNTYGITNDAYVYNVVNSQYAHFQCMEPQIAASLATEMGISANTDFKWNGGTWHYEVPTIDGINVKSLADNKMNCRIYKDIAFSDKTIGGKANCSGHVNLRCALAEGVNPVGDIWWYQGGGCDIIYTCTTAGSTTGYKYSFYLEPDQSKWRTGTYVTSGDVSNYKHVPSSGTTIAADFEAETYYKPIITDSTVGYLGNGYVLSRTGYTPLNKKGNSGSNTTGECTYQYRSMSDSDAYTTVGTKTRRRVIFRGLAHDDHCSPRYLDASNRPSRTDVYFGCAAQVLLA